MAALRELPAHKQQQRRRQPRLLELRVQIEED